MASGVTDYLDGYLARRLNQITRIGTLLDPLADRLYTVATVLALTIRGITPVWLIVVLVARDLYLTLLLPVLRRHGYGPLPVSYLGKAATLNLLYAFPLLLLSSGTDTLATVARPVGWAFTLWGTALYLLAAGLYTRHLRLLVAADGSAGAPDLRATPPPTTTPPPSTTRSSG